MPKVVACVLLLALAVGCRPPELHKPTARKAEPPGAATPEQLAERFFKAMQADDVELALSTFPTDEILRQHLKGRSDLPDLLRMNGALLERSRAAFAEIRATLRKDGFDIRTAKIADINVERNPTGGGRESFGRIVLGIEVRDLHIYYEVEFDDGMKFGDRWYFTDYIREIRRTTLL